MIALIDYGMGNLKSVKNALDCVGADVKTTSRKSDLEVADGIIIPGVGSFADGMKNLEQLELTDTIKEEVLFRKKPYMGICLGMQFLAETSCESIETKGFNFIPGKVEKLNPADKKKFKTPHMGWNNLRIKNPGLILKDIGDDPVVYFVHGYNFNAESRYVSATCSHGQDIVASVFRDNIFGVQFHPEKSQGIGLKILENFCTFVKKGCHA